MSNTWLQGVTRVGCDVVLVLGAVEVVALAVLVTALEIIVVVVVAVAVVAAAADSVDLLPLRLQLTCVTTATAAATTTTTAGDPADLFSCCWHYYIIIALLTFELINSTRSQSSHRQLW